MTRNIGQSIKVFPDQVQANMACEPNPRLSDDEIIMAFQFKEDGLDAFRTAERIVKSREDAKNGV